MRLSAARSGPAPAAVATAQPSAPASATEPIAWVSLRIAARLGSHSCCLHDRRAPSRAASQPRRDEDLRRSVPVVTRAELPRLALRFLARDAVSFLQPARELIAVSFQLGEVIVRELAPLLLDAALDLLPLTGGAIAVHDLGPSSWMTEGFEQAAGLAELRAARAERPAPLPAPPCWIPDRRGCAPARARAARAPARPSAPGNTPARRNRCLRAARRIRSRPAARPPRAPGAG